MTVISRNDFDNWKSDPVTKAFFQAAQERVEEAKDVLSVEAGLNPVQDNTLRGLIKAYREMQDFSVEYIEEIAN